MAMVASNAFVINTISTNDNSTDKIINKYDISNECPICFEDMVVPTKLNCCKNKFHKECINKWYNYTHSYECPCCCYSNR